MCEGFANFPFQILLVIFHSQYRNVMCIDRVKVKIIYSGRFKENWYMYRQYSQIMMIRKYIHLRITLMEYLCVIFRIYVCVLQRFGVHSVNSWNSWMRNLLFVKLWRKENIYTWILPQWNTDVVFSEFIFLYTVIKI